MQGKHLTHKERFYIEKRRGDGVNQATIARELELPRSTISRELRRNTDAAFNGVYSCRRAETLARGRRRASPAAKCARGARLPDEPVIRSPRWNWRQAAPAIRALRGLREGLRRPAIGATGYTAESRYGYASVRVRFLSGLTIPTGHDRLADLEKRFGVSVYRG
ncbi:helix-turn-helix domain-containing protein [Symbiopectobacterium purcellii]|uniref:helix-turn-helix domain-containing protein n=1 Tax=Symbiopectobacterium purcellii TaxID=2871826 RepID=UPI003F858426